jgi:hypothetical protein
MNECYDADDGAMRQEEKAERKAQECLAVEAGRDERHDQHEADKHAERRQHQPQRPLAMQSALLVIDHEAVPYPPLQATFPGAAFCGK